MTLQPPTAACVYLQHHALGAAKRLMIPSVRGPESVEVGAIVFE